MTSNYIKYPQILSHPTPTHTRIHTHMHTHTHTHTNTHTHSYIASRDRGDGAKLSDSSVSRYSRTHCGNGQFDHRPPARPSNQLPTEPRKRKRRKRGRVR